VIIAPAAPVGTVNARVYLRAENLTSGTTWVTGDFIHYDGVQLEEGDFATAYTPRTNEILPGTILASQIATNTITAGQIAGTTITAAKIATGTITATQIQAGTITANLLNFVVGGSNMVTNSSFEDTVAAGADGWATFNCTTTYVTSQAFHGSRSIQLVATGTTMAVYKGSPTQASNCQPGQVLTGSAWVKHGNNARPVAISYRFWDAGGVQVGTDLTGTIVVRDLAGAVVTNTTSTDWRRFQSTVTAPAGAVKCGIIVYPGFSGGVTGDIAFVDGVQLEPGNVAGGYAPMPGEILPGTVGPTQITPNSITTNQIITTGLTAGAIATDAITSIKIQAGAVNAS
jgi:hypothetical protein